MERECGEECGGSEEGVWGEECGEGVGRDVYVLRECGHTHVGGRGVVTGYLLGTAALE